ncbi:MAG TPA: aminomethyl-transferring glycine dehydrogenase [Vicinamibacterales bacterium]|nr:aminomethyl-transferring glycine dehydrogenase [Vicinamibacterales bacterium]
MPTLPSPSSPAASATVDTARLGDFASRHLGPRPDDVRAMLATVGAASLDALVDEIIPPDIRLDRRLALPAAESEPAYLARLRAVAGENRLCRSYIGLGYHDTITPAVIARLVFENPGWYTPYTPYQAEIAQGRLESLLNFQTMTAELAGMAIANASLLDEATAAAEAVALLHRVRQRPDATTVIVSDRVFPHVAAVLASRVSLIGLTVRVESLETATFGPDVFAVYAQSPDDHGALVDLAPVIARAHEAGVLVGVGTDPLALAIVTPPGDAGADVVIGNAQRLGVPLGYGGPHAAFFATREQFARQMPGRLIGVSVDSRGRRAYRMALQTREQHIRREKATSNICTAQALLANITAFYGVFHGPEGLRAIATRVHDQAVRLEAALVRAGWRQTNASYFDTLRLEGTPAAVSAVRDAAETRGLNFRYPEPGAIQISLNETVTETDLADIASAFADRTPIVVAAPGGERDGDVHGDRLAAFARRTSPFMTHPVFHAHRSETEIMRYIRRLERKDLGLDTAMIPLGSCTMKLNAAAEMVPVSWPEFARLHPFAPINQTAGYQHVISDLQKALAAITGLPAVSLQPNSGAQGELAGLLVIRAYHRSRGDAARRVALIPQSAHGTNPASAVLAGLSVVIVRCDERGNIDVDDLRAKAEAHASDLACLMVTYPSTHGVFERGIREICAIVHEHGGQVYMDGANMNAQVGLTSPAAIGADVCHLNLHKTFAIPHGGGGPGMGPIAAAAHLAPFVPGHPLVPSANSQAIAPVSAAPWGSASILLISYGYLCLLGGEGATEATRVAMLNANYIKARLEPNFPVLYTGERGRVAHELIFDLRPFKAETGIDEQDVAKRLMDYGFHAPTVSFPVPGTLMVEPTESESKAELDRFCEAMLAIREEIRAVADGRSDRQDNVLKHAPHTAEDTTATEWPHAYSREQAAYPVASLRGAKFWPAVSRIDNPFGDRHLVCACPPVEDYE